MKAPFSKTLEKLRAGARDIAAELERVRTDRLGNIAEIERLTRAPITDDEIEAKLDAWMDGEAKRAAEFMTVIGLTTPNVEGLQQTPHVEDSLKSRPLATMLAIGFRPIIRAELLKQAREQICGEQIGAKERQTRLAKLNDELRALEIAEEQLCRACEECGLTVHRRDDVDPELVLAEEL